MSTISRVSSLCYRFSFAWVAILASSQSAQAGYLVGVSSGFTPGNAPTVRINPLTGEYSTIHNQGNSYNSLAQNSTGEFFGGWSSVTAEAGRVSRIDVTTGAVLETFNAVTPGAGSSRGLSFDAADNLYAVINRDDSSGSPTLDDDLYSFDLMNETTTRIGSLGFGAVQGLDIAPNGTFYAWDIAAGLLTVDPNSGLATDVNPSVGGSVDIQSIVFTPDGRLFGARRNLYQIDPSTGTFSQIGAGSGIDLRGIEYVVPEPTSGVLLLATLVFSALYYRPEATHDE